MGFFFHSAYTRAIGVCIAVLLIPALAFPASERFEAGKGGAQFAAGYGYRHDEFDWNIAGTIAGTDPNVLSELTWSDLLIHQLEMGMRIEGKAGLLLRSAVDYGWIVDGENQDSDYLEDNRLSEYSRSDNQSDSGNTLDFSVGLGYLISLGRSSITFAPLVGYSYHRQELTMSDGYQTLPNLGAFSGLNSSYDAAWRGPWVGLELNVDLKKTTRRLPPVMLRLGLELHWAEYDAAADWNMRADFMHPNSFEHEADGRGERVFVGIWYKMSRRTALGLIYEQQRWHADDGVDRLFLSDGRVLDTRLNEVNWYSRVMCFELSIRF